MTEISSSLSTEDPRCPECGSVHCFKDGLRYAQSIPVQRWLCRVCGFRFSDPRQQLELSSRRPSKMFQNADPAMPIFLIRQGSSGQVGVLTKAKNLPAAIVDKTIVGEVNDRLLQYAWQAKKKGLKDNTIKIRVLRLNKLEKLGANLDDTDSVETVLATETWTPSNKWEYVQTYKSYTKLMNIQWEKIKVQHERKKQYDPSRNEVDALVSGLGRETSAFCQALADTGARSGELCKLEWSEVDTEKFRIYINKPEKNSKARVIHVPERTIAVIMTLPRIHGKYIFNPNVHTLQSCFARTRERIAQKRQMPSLLNIHFHSLRRFFADQTYKKSHFNTRKVQHLLGHKRLTSTEQYFGDFDPESCTYETERATTIEEAEELRQQGYELYDTFIENGKTIKLYSRLT